MKNYKPIIIVAGEPYSVFLEIFFKALKYKKYKSPLIIICSKKLILSQMKKFNFKKRIRLINSTNLKNYSLNNKSINLINVKLDNLNKKNLIKSNSYIKKCFEEAFNIINNGISNKLINGPISKKKFLNKKFLGMTEYISEKFNINNKGMLIYNKRLSVCPITTHLPLKFVAKNINQKMIIQKIELINDFYEKNLNIKPKIAILGLNPHCESVDKFNEDEKIIKPTIKLMKKIGFKVSGPYPADTIFLKNNRKNFNVIVGMYHDQVLTPLKTIHEYDAINITLGLPFTRISPDHGPNEKMIGKNLSNPLSLINSIKFLDKN
ncbi:MAG: 4-hydroxythreonine-4-phosphate dehydrogenase [Pelagibacterales bacterium MED-G42]|mgnify:CR=1 FL=1|nr:MAG: 4-hydroxythreonine-4-phosphate dehydrogenase [Pelagibacterales bacterium MED-G42]